MACPWAARRISKEHNPVLAFVGPKTLAEVELPVRHPCPLTPGLKLRHPRQGEQATMPESAPLCLLPISPCLQRGRGIEEGTLVRRAVPTPVVLGLGASATTCASIFVLQPVLTLSVLGPAGRCHNVNEVAGQVPAPPFAESPYVGSQLFGPKAPL